MNTMRELKHEVQSRLQHLDGRYFESASTVTIEEMIGVIEVGEEYHPDKIDGTLLDLSHEFWDEYVRDLNSEKAVREEVQVAIRLLRDEGRFRMVEPEDDELQGVSVEVEPVDVTRGRDFRIEVEEADTNIALQIITDDGVYETIVPRK